MPERKRWLAFYLLCAGEFALPSIQADLAFSDAALVWVVNAGALVCALCFTLLAPDRSPARARRLDVRGAVTVAIEARVSQPLMPLRLFRLRSVTVSNVIGVLWAASMFAWFFISALYMQLVLGYDVDPGESGLASGVVNTSFMMGGALGLAALASLSEAKGYHAAFAAGAAFAALAAVIAFTLLREPHPALAKEAA